MRKFGKESAAPGQMGADRENSGKGWLKDHWCVLILCFSVIVAFALRTVFAYGISADGDFALSGGSGAQYHLHVIESIMNGSYSLTDSAVNYPNGGLALYPPFMDFICAGIGSVLSAFGLSTAEAAAASVAVFNPIIGALTCIPVYLLGKEMFDKKVGAISALVFAFLALPISTTVFSSGTEYGLAAFLLAFMSLFVVKMVKAADAAEPSRKSILVNAAIAGIFLLLSALTWNGFRFVVVLLVVAMVIQIVVDRFRGRDFTDVLLGYAITIVIGAIVSAAYYIPAGLWDAVFSGPFLIAVVALVLSFAFLALRAKPWVVTIPALVVVFVVICAVMAFAAPDMLDDFIFGNSIYSSSIMESLASSHVSMSNVSSYYGWLTMWLPICFAIYSTYVYLRKDHSATQLFITVWMFVMFFAVWTTSANAAVVGSVFAVGSAVVLVRVIQAADLRAWWTSMKTAGFPGLFRKMIKPLPFVSVLATALLIIVPNVSFAVDAGISSNSDADYYFSGNTSYTIKTGDAYSAEKVWDHYADVDKKGALASWIDYSYDAVNHGGFDSVTDTIGGGSTAVAQMLLAKGAAGTTAASLMRIVLAHNVDDFASAFSGHSDVYDKISSYVKDPSTATEAIDKDPATYGKIRSDITDENAVYLASIEAMTSSMSTADIMKAYESVCSTSGDKIGYYMVDGSLLPLQYNDGDYFSTLAYFADYKTDSYGAASQYFSYNTYYGYTTYTDAIYETFLWKAMIGPSATEAGYSSSYSYLVALASSDGSKSSAMAIPGYGLAGYSVGFWQVRYNADSTATTSSDGWVYMDGYEAIAKQKADGGVINYLSSIVVLEYVGTSQAQPSISGTVTADSKTVDGATVSVYSYDETYGKYVLYSQAKTINGAYNAFVPAGDYTLTVSVGGVDLQSYKSGAIPQNIQIDTADVSGAVKVGDDVYSAEKMRLDLVGSASLQGESKTITVWITNGTISQSSVLPGTYTYTLYSETGTSLGTGSVTFASGSTTGFAITPTTKTITATVNDKYGNSVEDGAIVVATNTVTGAQFQAEVEDGKAVITAIPGKYNLSMGQGMVSMYTSVSDVSSGNRTATITAYDAQTVSVSGASSGVLAVYAGEFSTLTYMSGSTMMFDVPVGLATGSVQYTIYGVSGGSVYHGVYTNGASASVSSGSFITVSGTLKDGDTAKSGTVRFISSNNEVFLVSTDSNGKYSVALPSGSYTIYADNGSNKVCFEQGYTASTATKDLSLVDGRKITYTLRYETGTSSTNAYLPFVKSIMKFTYNEKSYTLYGMSNTSGASVFYIPDNVESTVSYNNEDGTMDNAYFHCTTLKKTVSSGTANNSSTTTISVYDSSKTDQENYVKQVSVRIPYDMEVKFYKDDSDVKSTYSAGTTQSLRPGQYTVTISGSTGHYFSGTAYVYPGQTSFTGLGEDDVQDVAVVTITKADSDKLTVTTEDGSYHYDTAKSQYYFQVGYRYYLTSTNTVNGKDTIAYGFLNLSDSSAGSTETVNVTASQEKIEVTGNVGVVADGTITVTYTANGRTVEHDFDISKGGYTLQLPSGTGTVSVEAKVTSTIDDETAYYRAEGTISDLRDGVVRNISVVTDPEGWDDDDDDDEEEQFDASIKSASFSNGTGSFTVSVTNLTKSAMTYVFTAGSALSFVKDYSLAVPASSTGTVEISVIYDQYRYAPGSDGFSVTVADINGKQTETVDITIGDDRTGSSDMGIYKMGQTGSEFNDKVSAYQYLYAITFDNKNVYSHDVSITVSGADSSWAVTIVDEDGAKVLAPGEAFKVYGLQTTVLYVKVMLLNADKGASASVPTITASINVDGSSSSMSIEPQTAKVSTGDMSASGTDIYNERSGMPGGVWFLAAVIILLIVAVAWLASKRGVFSRRS